MVHWPLVCRPLGGVADGPWNSMVNECITALLKAIQVGRQPIKGNGIIQYGRDAVVNGWKFGVHTDGAVQSSRHDR